MEQVLIDKLNGMNIYIGLSGDNDDDVLESGEYDRVEYHIKDGKLLTWDAEEVLTLEDINNEWWLEDRGFDCTEADIKYWFKCLITDISRYVIEDGLPGADEMNHISDDCLMAWAMIQDQDDITYGEFSFDFNTIL